MWATNGKWVNRLETKPSVQTGGFFVGDGFTGRLFGGLKIYAACKAIWVLKTGSEGFFDAKQSQSIEDVGAKF